MVDLLWIYIPLALFGLSPFIYIWLVDWHYFRAKNRFRRLQLQKKMIAPVSKKYLAGKYSTKVTPLRRRR